MIYNQLNLNHTNTFSSQSIGNVPKIEIYYNDTSIHSIAGPVPVVDISYSFNNNGNNLADSLTTSITLNGKIYRRPEGASLQNVDPKMAHPGFSGIISAVSGLKQLFQETPYGVLEFRCGTNKLHTISGLRVIDLTFNNTPDNWVQTADYSIKLETNQKLWEGTGNAQIEKFVTDRQDSWSIEPIDDTAYSSFSQDVTNRTEYSNPKLNRATTAITNAFSETNPLSVVNIPQFRVTRKLSAKGSVVPLSTNLGKINRSNLADENTKPYVFAKAWVEYKSKQVFGTSDSPNNSSPYVKYPFASSDNLFLFNHNRTINIDIFNGTYETNDTWLALPTGIPYTETYTLETSTSEDYIRTVRVAGNIIGLSIPHQDLIYGTSGVLPSGTGTNGDIDSKLSLGSYMMPNQSLVGSYSSVDITNSTTTGGSLSAVTPLPNKYENARDAWVNHIKPLLYRRAHLAVNYPTDRTLTYIPPYAVTPPVPPNNPIYSKETLLSTIPVNTSESHDPRKGIINYSYEYNSKLNIISGVVSENINVTYTNPIDSTTEIAVIGRALGPILQRTGRSLPRKSISIDIAIPPPTSIRSISLNHPECPLHKTGYLFQTIEQIIEAHRPYSPSTFIPNEPLQTEGLVYTSDDNEQWNPSSGKYSRSLTWVYQQASISRDFRDH